MSEKYTSKKHTETCKTFIVQRVNHLRHLSELVSSLVVPLGTFFFTVSFRNFSKDKIDGKIHKNRGFGGKQNLLVVCLLRTCLAEEF